jgi:hypothetical protein
MNKLRSLSAALMLCFYAKVGHDASSVARQLAGDGRERTDEPRVAVTDALVVIAEDDLTAEFVETDKDCKGAHDGLPKLRRPGVGRRSAPGLRRVRHFSLPLAPRFDDLCVQYGPLCHLRLYEGDGESIALAMQLEGHHARVNERALIAERRPWKFVRRESASDVC